MNTRTIISGALTVAVIAGLLSVFPVGLPGDGSAGAGTADNKQNVSEAYVKLTEELKLLEQTAVKERSAVRRNDMLKEMDTLLAEFISNYRDTPEAYAATFEAGLVNFTLQKPKKVVRHLEVFLDKATDAPDDKKAYAHFYLAEAYKQLGKVDEAEAEYNIILDRYRNTDRRLLQAVNQSTRTMDNERRLKVGSEPIAFEVTGIDGRKISLAQYKGKVVLLDFWATWCGPCRKEMPTVKKVYSKYKNKGFDIVGISLDKSRPALDRYLDSNEIGWSQYYDGKFWQNEVAVKYGISSIPATFLIDKKGKIRYKSLRGHQLEVAVKELLAE